MASAPNRAHHLDAVLDAIPQLSGPILAQIIDRAIERLDEIDGDADLEPDDEDTSVEDSPLGFDPEEDMCLAGDDRIASGSCTGAGLVCEDSSPGDADDAEPDGRGIRHLYRNATRRRACEPTYYRAWNGRLDVDGYRLRREPTVPPKRKLLASRLLAGAPS